MTVFAILKGDKIFQEKNCYTTGHQLRNVIRHAHYKIRSLGFPFTANSTTTTQKQSDYKVDKSSFTLICFDSKLAVIGLMETRPNGNQALCG